MAIEVQGLEIQIGARTLLHPTNFHVAKGDKIGLVGRNGAGKTTLTRVITGDMLPTAGKVRVSGKLGYLPQDTHASDPTQTALDRMMSARDIATIINRIRKAEKDMTDPDPDVMSKAMTRYDKAMQDFDKAGGYAAQSEAISMAASLGLPQEVMEQQLGTLSGGQRRRIELARILFSNADTLILDEPTNHLDADSIEWLRGYLKKYEGGFLVISHSTELLDEVVNKVWHLDAQLGQIDMYSLGWKAYLHQRVVDEERRRRTRSGREEGRPSHEARHSTARQGHQGRGGAEHDAPCRKAAGKHLRGAEGREGGGHPFPRARALRPHADHGQGYFQGLRFQHRVRRREPGHRQGLACGDPRLQRCRQDHHAAPAGPHRGAGHRFRGIRSRLQRSATSRRSTTPWIERHRVGETCSMWRPSSITRRPVRFSARSCSPVTTR